MSTTYNNTIKIHSEWKKSIVSVWVAYKSGSNDEVYFDQPSLSTPIAPEGHYTVGNITSETGQTDRWSIAFADSDGHLWATDHQFTDNISHDDGEVELSIYDTSGDKKVHIKMPNGDIDKVAIGRF